MQKTGNTLRIATRPEENRATAICSMHKKLVKFGYVVLELCKRTDKQTNKQTYSSQYSTPLRFYGAPCVFLSSDRTRSAYCLPVVLDCSIWLMFAFVMEAFEIYVSVHLKLTSGVA